jgi:hypothetical protein
MKPQLDPENHANEVIELDTYHIRYLSFVIAIISGHLPFDHECAQRDLRAWLLLAPPSRPQLPLGAPPEVASRASPARPRETLEGVGVMAWRHIRFQPDRQGRA